jgi:hypothetical protein
VWLGWIVAAAALVHIGALDGAADELLGGFNDGLKRVAIVRIAEQCLGMQNELSTSGAHIGGHDRDLDAELVGALALPLPMHSNSGAWKE